MTFDERELKQVNISNKDQLSLKYEYELIRVSLLEGRQSPAEICSRRGDHGAVIIYGVLYWATLVWN